jgi:glycerol-3-phosphate dehydrogenase
MERERAIGGLQMSHEDIENLLEAASQICGLVEGSERGRMAYLRALGIILSAGAYKEKAAEKALRRAGIELSQ